MKEQVSIRRSHSGDWIAIPRPVAEPRVRLLCFAHGGGSAYAFYAWPGALPRDVEVCAVQLPGRGSRLLEASPTRVEQIVDSLWQAFQPLRRAPVALFGHSLGAWIAFEFGCRLQSEGVPPAHLFVSGASAPQLSDREGPIRHLPDAEFVAEVCRRYEGVPEAILRDAEMMAICLPALRADFAIKETYSHAGQMRLGCPISAFGGLQDRSATGDRVEAWRERTSGAFSQRMFPGGHFFVDSARREVLAHVAADLDHSIREIALMSAARAGA